MVKNSRFLQGNQGNALTRSGSFLIYLFPQEAGYPKSARSASSQLAPLHRHFRPGRRDTRPRPTG